MSGYYLPWVLLMAASLWVSLAGFFWALRYGQFSEQERARYLPLRGELGAPPDGNAPLKRRDTVVPIMVLGIGSLIMATVVVLIYLLPGGR